MLIRHEGISEADVQCKERERDRKVIEGRGVVSSRQG
jgi:hypothetical protein